MKSEDLLKQEVSRRDFIKTTATAAGASLFAPGIFSGCRIEADISAKTGVMDEALKMMSDFAPLTNHGPMAAEALISLERDAQVINFVRSYRKRFSSVFPPKYQTITNNNWQEALGDERRTTDWIEFFNRELKENDWKKVLEKWSENLAPGLSAAAAHGLIRSGHAGRSLTREETDPRKHELAQALAYWAAYYQVLPETGNGKNERLSLSEAIKKIPILPPEKRARGSIIEQLKALDDFPSFGAAIDFVEVGGKPETLLSELTEAFAAVYAKNVSTRNNIALIHAVTGLASVRHLLPYLSDRTTKKMLRYGWQAAAAIRSISGDETNNQIREEKINSGDLIEKAATSNEEHAIKFTEACIGEYALNRKQIYLQAAKTALGRLPRHS